MDDHEHVVPLAGQVGHRPADPSLPSEQPRPPGIERLATGNQESMRNIGQDRIRQIRIPIMPPEQTDDLLAEVSRRLSLVSAFEGMISTALSRAESLRQSILKRAFEGNLVPQDPNDEPADVLIGRIRSERAPQANNGQAPRRNAESVSPRSTLLLATATELPAPAPRKRRSPAARRARGRNR